MNDLEAIKKAIYIIENSANTHEPEVDETLKRLQVIVKRKEYYNTKKGYNFYGSKAYKNN